MIGVAAKVRQGWLSVMIPDRKLDWAVGTTKRFVSRYLDDVLRDNKPPERDYIFLHELVRSGASHDQVVEGLLAMMVAGRDTTASALTSLFWCLSRDARVQKKLVAEIDALGGELPTWEQLKDMRYLVYCVKEGMSAALLG